MKCTHYACRCARAVELLAMYDRTGDSRLLREAIDVHGSEVTCRAHTWTKSPGAKRK